MLQLPVQGDPVRQALPILLIFDQYYNNLDPEFRCRSIARDLYLYYYPATNKPFIQRNTSDFSVFWRYFACIAVERSCLSIAPADTIAWDGGGDLIVVIREWMDRNHFYSSAP